MRIKVRANAPSLVSHPTRATANVPSDDRRVVRRTRLFLSDAVAIVPAFTDDLPRTRMTITLYGIRNCDTVKKARAWLDGAGIAYAFHDYKTAGVDADRLRDWVDRLGWDAVLNRTGTTFRKLPEADRLDLDAPRATAVMLANPSAIRRPVLVAGTTLLVGFTPELYAAAGLASGG